VSPTIDAFFLWQAAISAAQTAWLGWYLWRRLPRAGAARPRFDPACLRLVWRFAAGVTGHAMMRVLLTHADKVILSRLLPLETFGYYMLAFTLASALNRAVEPVFAAFFPRFSELVGRHDQAGLVSTYHRACQLVSVLVLPASLVLALFAAPVLQLWTGNPVIARQAHLLLSLLVLGVALNSLMSLPYGLQLAHGWTGLTFWYNLAALALWIPGLLWATLSRGALGAAWVSLALNASYVLIQVPIMHRRVLRGEARRWYLADVGAPLLAAAAVAVAGTLAVRGVESPPALAAAIAAVSAATLGAAALTVPWLREGLARAVRTGSAAMARP
jgi:O-antigen/teichoic acid export membrane protein